MSDVKKWLFAAGVVGAVFVSGCSSTSNTSTSSTLETSATTTSVPSGEANTYSLIGGGTIDLTRGPTAQPMAMWFWAPG